MIRDIQLEKLVDIRVFLIIFVENFQRFRLNKFWKMKKRIDWKVSKPEVDHGLGPTGLTRKSKTLCNVPEKGQTSVETGDIVHVIPC